jgi:hypothetical protein
MSKDCKPVRRMIRFEFNYAVSKENSTAESSKSVEIKGEQE